MERKIVGQGSLIIAMAKHIKACAKELKEHNRIGTKFKFVWYEDHTEVVFHDKCLCFMGKLSFGELAELTDSALKESCCNGVVYPDGDACWVMLFGKPTKPFNMLQRLVKKYTGIDVSWDSCKTVYYDENGKEIVDETNYLCYNGKVCQDGVDFIRNVRTSKDILKADIANRLNFITDKEKEIHKPYIRTELKLFVETPHGKQKGQLTLVG